MNTWEGYKQVEDQLRGAVANARATLDAIIDPVHRLQPLTAAQLEPHLLQIRLQVAFIAAAHAQLALIETAEARRDLTRDAPVELPDCLHLYRDPDL